MRMFIAILICRVLHFCGSIIGGFSSLPGKLALRICPDVLKKVKLCENIIAVTGSNGKTSTTELIATTLRKSGVNAVYNKEGSNQIEGVTTLILSNCDFSGNFKPQALVIESDERYARLTFKYFTPKCFLITNLLRDQLTRNRHPEWIFNIISQCISPNSKLILNADDPIVASFGIKFENAIYYTVNKTAISSQEPMLSYDAGAFCPNCKMPLQYEYRNYGSLGRFKCTNCSNGSANSQFAVTNVDIETKTIEINNKFQIQTDNLDIHNIYNLLAAFVTCSCCEVKQSKVAQALSNHKYQTGRVLNFVFNGSAAELLISKHENSMSYNCSITHVLNQNEDVSVLIVVDRISRKYFTSETSWLWDIDFEKLNTDRVKSIILGGKYCYDLLVRFNSTEIPKEKIFCEPDFQLLKNAAKTHKQGKLFVLTCLADQERVIKELTN